MSTERMFKKLVAATVMFRGRRAWWANRVGQILGYPDDGSPEALQRATTATVLYETGLCKSLLLSGHLDLAERAHEWLGINPDSYTVRGKTAREFIEAARAEARARAN